MVKGMVKSRVDIRRTSMQHLSMDWGRAFLRDCFSSSNKSIRDKTPKIYLVLPYKLSKQRQSPAPPP